MNALIVENEKPAAEKLGRLVKKIDKSIRVAAVIETVEDAVRWFRRNPSPDLILMDIQLDDGLCFEIFEAVPIDAPVIFTTAYDEYAIRAFKVNSVDYLLKPITEESLASALEKLNSVHYSHAVTNEKINRIYEQLGGVHKTRFFTKVGEHCKSIPTKEIACFYIVERCTFFSTLSGKRYDVGYSLEQTEKLLDPRQFFRINRCMILNIDAVTDIVGYSANRLKIRLANWPDTDDLIVSRERVSEFKKWMDR